MKTLLISYKFLFMTLTVLPLAMCSSDEDITNEEETAQLVELSKIRQTPIYNSSNGFSWNDVNYSNTNVSLLSYSTSEAIGEFGASNADEELEIIMEILRKKTIDKNKEKGATVNYKKAWQYNLLDAVMNKSDYYISKKDGADFFFTKDKKFKIKKYLMGSRYVPGFAFSSAGLFRSFGNNPLTLESILAGTIYYTEDDVFSYDESTNIPMYQFVDYRMLLHLRFLVRNGARDITLKGIKEDGTEMLFNLDTDSDLIALSNEFEDNNIEILWFLTKGDYRVDYFEGIIFSDEASDGDSHRIEYRYGEPIFD